MRHRDVTITALMTAGRYENTWCRTHIEFALRELGIPLVVSGGVYYGQCMQNMLTDAIANKTEFAVTIDGDSVFTTSQLRRLISIAAQESQTIDAICGMQVRRGAKTALGTIEGSDGYNWSGYPMKVDTAHFGLTVINLAKLANTTKPWFFCRPNADGDWTGNKLDSDVWFWKQWKAAGHSIYMDPGCRIGHLEEMIVMHSATMAIEHIYPVDWVEANNKREDDQAVEAVEETFDRAHADVT